jgi:integrase
MYTLVGRGARRRYFGTFKRVQDAKARKRWVNGEIAAMRRPELSSLTLEPAQSPTLRDAVDRWRASRINVSQGTRTNDRVNTERVLRHDAKLATCRVNQLDVERWAQMFADLAATYERGTLKKSKEALAMVYDHLAIDPNPLRDPRVKLPHARPADMVVPISAHVEAVARVLPGQHLLPYLVIDWTGLRIGAVEEARIADLDEHRQALLARASVAKNRKPMWVGLHDVLFEAIVAQLPPRDDRDLDAPLFPGFKQANLRSSIRRACRATGTPAFSPHGLRKRRGSLLGKQGYSLAEIAERLGDTKVVTAEHYLYAIGDYAEVDYEDVLQRERTAAGVLQEPAGTPPRSHTGSHIANIVSLKPFD